MSKKTVQVEGTQEINGREIEYSATVELFYDPGKLYGKPEDCYPSEAEANIITLATIPPQFEEKLDAEKIEELAWEKWDDDEGEDWRTPEKANDGTDI